MDMIKYGITEKQIDIARDLACRSLFCYQPFSIGDELQTGMGFQGFMGGGGLVHTKIIPEKYKSLQESNSGLLVAPADVQAFRAANDTLDALYVKMLDFIESRLGGISNLEFSDIGCCSGYFSVNLAARGAKKVTAYDRIDYSESFALLNGLLGTNAQFHNRAYKRGTIEGAQESDVAISVAVLVHISDVLHHLAFLGRLARKAVFVWTNTMADPDGADDELLIRFRDHNTYYKNDEFPYCFDQVFISPKLLRLSFSLMGFTQIHEFTDFPSGISENVKREHRGYLAIRA